MQDHVVWHIPHQYSREMSEKSTVVSYIIVFFVSVTVMATPKSASFHLHEDSFGSSEEE